MRYSTINPHREWMSECLNVWKSSQCNTRARMFVIILAAVAGPARPVRACIVIYGSLSSPTTTRLRHNHVRFTNTCIIYTDLFRRRAYAGGLLQSYSVRVKSAVTQHALSVLFYGKIRSHQWTLQLNLPIIFKCQFKNRINWPSNVVIADNVYDIKVIGVPIFYFQIGNTIPYYVAVRVVFICTMRLVVYVCFAHGKTFVKNN